ncbi:MAG: hypothetical protein KGP14_13505, partial [Betaproteobacteria bacterium]|nr:hypothetical protein [Betaproteobacteria bacterium]
GLSHDSGLLMDLRYSYAKADQWRAGSSRKATEAPSGSDTEIENKRTINQIVNLNMDYSVNKEWAVMLGVPYVMRDHQHTFDSSTAVGAFEQQSKFNELGDISVQTKYKIDLGGQDSGAGIRFGMKFPTGATNKTMTPPDPSNPDTPYKLERSSQPGTGSTDGIVGFYYFRNTPGNAFGWFVSGQFQSAIAIKDSYRPGNEVAFDAGMHYETMEKLNLLLQLNSQDRSRDTGGNAIPASGGYSINISPGLSYALGVQAQIYGFLQVPILRYVNTDPADSASGQLAARWIASVGITQRF